MGNLLRWHEKNTLYASDYLREKEDKNDSKTD